MKSSLPPVKTQTHARTLTQRIDLGLGRCCLIEFPLSALGKDHSICIYQKKEGIHYSPPLTY